MDVDRALIVRICSHFDSGFDVACDVDIDSKFAASRVPDPTEAIFHNYIFGSMGVIYRIRPRLQAAYPCEIAE